MKVASIIILPKNMLKTSEIFLLTLLLSAVLAQSCVSTPDPSLLIQAGTHPSTQEPSRSPILTSPDHSLPSGSTPTLSPYSILSPPPASKSQPVLTIPLSHQSLGLHQFLRQPMGLFCPRRTRSHSLLSRNRSLH